MGEIGGAGQAPSSVRLATIARHERSSDALGVVFLSPYRSLHCTWHRKEASSSTGAATLKGAANRLCPPSADGGESSTTTWPTIPTIHHSPIDYSLGRGLDDGVADDAYHSSFIVHYSL